MEQNRQPAAEIAGATEGWRNRIDYALVDALAEHMHSTNAAGVSNVVAELRILHAENPAKYLDLCAALCLKEQILDADITVRTIVTGVPRTSDAPKAVEAEYKELPRPVVIEPRAPGYTNLGNEETGVRVGLELKEPKPEAIRYPEEWYKTA